MKPKLEANKRNRPTGVAVQRLVRPKHPRMTYQIAWAIAGDEGNRHAGQHGRKAWNSADFDAATRKLDEVITKHDISA